MQLKTTTLFSIFIFFTLIINAQTKYKVLDNESEIAKTRAYLNGLSKEEYKKLFFEQHSRIPSNLRKGLQNLSDKKSAEVNHKKSASSFRTDVRFPGEYEEQQGIFISWPYLSGIIDVSPTSSFAYIYFQLADAIQKSDVTAFINVQKASDTNKVKQAMVNEGTPLFNYKFLVEAGDDVWARDFGPVPFYYGAKDSIGWIDFKYYDGRDSDNLLPIKWGKTFNIPVITSKLGYEGGNILMDGRGKLNTTSMVYDLNSLSYGYSKSMVDDSLKFYTNHRTKDVMTLLPNDGGTGHIDLYIDMFDENTYVIAKFPTRMDSIPNFPDYKIAAKNIDTLMSRSTLNSKPYRFRYLPLPTKDNGQWYTSGPDYDKYTRTYANHLIVNKSIIQPIFNDGLTGNKKGDSLALIELKKAYPGYTFRPIDMRDFDGSGGSIHCITKEFPAENPLTIWHYAWDGEVPGKTSYPIDATIHNKSGIANAKVYYRLKGTTNWTSIPMSLVGGEDYTTGIPMSGVGAIEYYIEATSNNGKKMTKPMTAPDGFYSFYSTAMSGIVNNDLAKFSALYPNPSNSSINIDFDLLECSNVEILIHDIAGKMVKSLNYLKVEGSQTLQLDVSNFSKGIFSFEVKLNGISSFKSQLIKE